MLKEQLINDLKEAMQNKDTIYKNTVQNIRAAILQLEKDKQIEATDDIIEDVLIKERKKRLDALTQFEKGNRQDLVDQTNKEIESIDKYLPKQMTKEKIEVEVDNYFKPLVEPSIKDMGKIMKDLKAKLGNKADASILAQLIRERLS